ncbi:MAG: hypothetical protein QOF78_2707 [Phycisphaerales bacterium]|nr:hypothetical protein [Phycisphaerales bacterium]MEA2735576.1 hypothetical protein [Humisphaera sp.]
MRYRFKGIVRTTGQTVEGHAHGDTPDVALEALSDHGIVTESLREDPEPLNMAGTSQPLSSAIDSALDTAASQVPFDKVAERYKGKNVWVLDRDKIRNRVAQVVDQAISEATNGMSMVGGGLNVNDLRTQVNEAIGGLFKDNRNLTSQVSDTSLKLENQIKRLETMVQRQESLLAQMTIAIGRIGSGGGGGGGGGWGPRRFAGQSAGGGEQNAVLLEIFKENLKLRGIEIDEPATAAANAGDGGGRKTATVPPPPIEASSDRPQRPSVPPGAPDPNNNDNGN